MVAIGHAIESPTHVRDSVSMAATSSPSAAQGPHLFRGSSDFFRDSSIQAGSSAALEVVSKMLEQELQEGRELNAAKVNCKDKMSDTMAKYFHRKFLDTHKKLMWNCLAKRIKVQ